MKQKHIILVDDDEDDRLLFGMAAARVCEKMLCTQFDSATDALATLKQMDGLPDCFSWILTCPAWTDLLCWRH